MTQVRKQPSGGTRLWLRWVLANALGETIGLGGTALVAAAVLYAGQKTGAYAALAGLVVVAGTLIEGTVVGTAQWLVLGRALPRMRWRIWVLATGAGAFVAWTLGMIPSTLLGSGGSEPSAEPAEAVVLGLAFIMGFVLGPILGLAQWLVLRRFVRNAALWMPANALAWAFGMVIIFLGVDIALDSGSATSTVSYLAVTIAFAGAIVGAVHGVALVWLVRPA
jgi:hypothetical protein